MLTAGVNKVLDISKILHIINQKAKLNTLFVSYSGTSIQATPSRLGKVSPIWRLDWVC